MAYRVVLDANVLFPFSLRDTLLRLAEHELYDCLWSERILDEMSSNLEDAGKMDRAGSQRLIDAMNTAFEDAIVPDEAIAALRTTKRIATFSLPQSQAARTGSSRTTRTISPLRHVTRTASPSPPRMTS